MFTLDKPPKLKVGTLYRVVEVKNTSDYMSIYVYLNSIDENGLISNTFEMKLGDTLMFLGQNERKVEGEGINCWRRVWHLNTNTIGYVSGLPDAFEEISGEE